MATSVRIHDSGDGTAATSRTINPQSLVEFFLDAPLGPSEDIVPLSPFMIYVWRQHETDAALERAEARQAFVYSFYDSFHRLRAPCRWPVPPNTLQWLNRPALDLSSSVGGVSQFPRQKRWLTRFMLHAWKHAQPDMDVYQGDGYLRFLTWFALECIPAWNLPPSLLPQEFLPVLNQPVRQALPMTAAMRTLGELHSIPGIPELRTAPDELALGISFEMLPQVLRAGDPRLIPDLVSQFWYSRFSDDPASITAYEYLAARMCLSDFAQNGDVDHRAVQRWYTERYLPVVPQADVFTTAPCGTSDDCLDPEDLNPPDKAIFVYRDHHTICGLSRAGLFTKEAISHTGMRVVDIDFSFKRDRMHQEYTDSGRTLHHARSSLHILNLNPEYVPECLMCHLSSLDDNHYFIGQFYWELSDISTIHESALSIVDEIWVASQYLKEVYEKHVSIPVCVMGQAVETSTQNSGFTRTAFGLPEDSYLFLFSFDAGSIVERKNPLGTVQAFRKAFANGSEKVALVLKTRNTGHLYSDLDREHWQQVAEIAAQDRRIRILDQTMTTEELHALHFMCDCYISLHRSEGFGYGPAEALALGKPVIATGYSGVVDFCTPETALLVDYALERAPYGVYPLTDKSRDYYWASPDIDGAARNMSRLYEDRDLGRRLGRAGRELILEQYSVEALRRRYIKRLTELGWLQT
jgi:glycosyltransferase involved in cell wall biosynthesis